MQLQRLVKNHLHQAYSKLDGIPFDYVMESNQPVKIHMDTEAAGSTSIPSLLGSSTQNAPGYEATFQGISKLCFIQLVLTKHRTVKVHVYSNHNNAHLDPH